MATDLGMFIHIQAQGTQQAISDIDRVSKSADNLEKKAGSAGGKVKDFGDGISKAGNNASHASGSIGLLGRAIAGLITVQTIRAMFDIGDSYNVMGDRVRLATNSLSEHDYAQKRLLASTRISNRLLSEAQELFVTTNGALRGLGYSLGESLDITDSLSYSFTKECHISR